MYPILLKYLRNCMQLVIPIDTNSGSLASYCTLRTLYWYYSSHRAKKCQKYMQLEFCHLTWYWCHVDYTPCNRYLKQVPGIMITVVVLVCSYHYVLHHKLTVLVDFLSTHMFELPLMLILNYSGPCFLLIYVGRMGFQSWFNTNHEEFVPESSLCMKHVSLFSLIFNLIFYEKFAKSIMLLGTIVQELLLIWKVNTSGLWTVSSKGNWNRLV